MAVGVRVMVGLGPGVAVSSIQGVIVIVSVGAGEAVSVGSGVAVAGAGVGESVGVPVGAMTSARVGYRVDVGPDRFARLQPLNRTAARSAKPTRIEFDSRPSNPNLGAKFIFLPPLQRVER